MLSKQSQTNLFLSQSSSNIGPGSYNLSFSLLNTTSKSQEKKQAYSIDNKSLNNNNNTSRASREEKQKSKGLQFPQTDSPGVGTYNPQPLTLIKGPIFKQNYYHNNGQFNNKSIEIPGPSYYSNISYSFTTKYSSERQVGFVKADRGLLKDQSNFVPGPTYYFQTPQEKNHSVQNYIQQLFYQKSITFPKSKRKINEFKVTPGPCSYNIIDDLSLYDKKLKFQKGIKIEQLKKFQKEQRDKLKLWCKHHQQIYFNQAKKRTSPIIEDDETINYQKKMAKQNKNVIQRLYKLKPDPKPTPSKVLQKKESMISPLEIEYQLQKKFTKGDFIKNSGRKLEFLGLKKYKEPSPDTYQIKREVADRKISINRSGRRDLFGITEKEINPGPGSYQMPSSFKKYKKKQSTKNYDDNDYYYS